MTAAAPAERIAELEQELAQLERRARRRGSRPSSSGLRAEQQAAEQRVATSSSRRPSCSAPGARRRRARRRRGTRRAPRGRAAVEAARREAARGRRRARRREPVPARGRHGARGHATRSPRTSAPSPATSWRSPPRSARCSAPGSWTTWPTGEQLLDAAGTEGGSARRCRRRSSVRPRRDRRRRQAPSRCSTTCKPTTAVAGHLPAALARRLAGRLARRAGGQLRRRRRHASGRVLFAATGELRQAPAGGEERVLEQLATQGAPERGVGDRGPRRAGRRARSVERATLAVTEADTRPRRGRLRPARGGPRS